MLIGKRSLSGTEINKGVGALDRRKFSLISTAALVSSVGPGAAVAGDGFVFIDRADAAGVNSNAAADPHRDLIVPNYITNRKISSSRRPGSAFGHERGVEVSYGTGKVLAYVHRRPGGRSDLEARDVRKEARIDFFKRFGASVRKSKRQSVLVFVHGYRYSFEDALTAAAQLKADLGFDGEIVVISWPAKTGLSDYPADEVNADWSTHFIRDALGDVLKLEEVESVQLVAHSLGCRATTTALWVMNNSDVRWTMAKIKNCVFAAPDLDAGIADRDLLPLVQKGKMRLTVYASDTDKAMLFSEWMADHPRVGSLARGIYTRPNIDVIDVSLIDDSSWGHSFVFQVKDVVADLRYLLMQGLSPAERHGLRRMEIPTGVYWQFRK